MKIIIIGVNQTSKLLCENLLKEKHEIIVIGSNVEDINYMTNHYSVTGIVGSGASRSTLIDAQVETADILIALSDIDEINIMSSMIAKKLGAKYTIAKVGRISYANDLKYIEDEFGVDYIFNSKYLIADEISKLIELPSSTKIESFFSNNCAIIEVAVTDENGLAGIEMKDLRDKFNTDFLIVSVRKNKNIDIPNGDYKMSVGDQIGILASFSSLEKILKSLKMYHKRTKKIFIVGCGEIGEYLIPKLIKQNKSISVVDSNMEQCKRLKEKFPDMKVSYGDGIDENVLFEEGIMNADACISLTNADEKNLTISMFAWASGIKSIITKTNSYSYAKLLHEVNIERTISPEMISLYEIIQEVRNRTVLDNDNNIYKYHKIFDNKIETIEFEIKNSFTRLNIEFKDERFKLKKNIIIGGIIRDGETIIPNGQSKILDGDHIIVISLSRSKIRTPEDIFTK